MRAAAVITTIATTNITRGTTVRATAAITMRGAATTTGSTAITRITTEGTEATAPAVTTAITIIRPGRTIDATATRVATRAAITSRIRRATTRTPATSTTGAAAAITRAESRRGCRGRGELRGMESPEHVDLRQATGMPILARIVVPVSAVEKEAVGEVRGMTREHCRVPLPSTARVVQAERTEGAWIVWYVEKVEAI